MMKALSRLMRDDLTRIGKKDRWGWVYWPWFRSAESLQRRGLVEIEYRDYQPPPFRRQHVRLTAAGRALLGANQPPDGGETT